MGVVLSYYNWRFRLAYVSDYQAWSAYLSIDARKERQAKMNYGKDDKKTPPMDEFAVRLDKEFWTYDVRLPLGLYLAAMISITINIGKLALVPILKGSA